MKTLKKTVAIAFLIFAISCTKDDKTPEPAPIVSEPASLLVKTVDSDDGLTSTY